MFHACGHSTKSPRTFLSPIPPGFGTASSSPESQSSVHLHHGDNRTPGNSQQASLRAELQHCANVISHSPNSPRQPHPKCQSLQQRIASIALGQSWYGLKEVKKMNQHLVYLDKYDCLSIELNDTLANSICQMGLEPQMTVWGNLVQVIHMYQWSVLENDQNNANYISFYFRHDIDMKHKIILMTNYGESAIMHLCFRSFKTRTKAVPGICAQCDQITPVRIIAFRIK
jgi:hypothetical protein